MLIADHSQSAIKVLIVDDEPLAQRLIRSLVDKEPGLTTIGCCSDGAQARQEILKLNPDLVFLDVQMPKMSGVELMQGLPRTLALPYVIFVTAFGQYAVQAFDVDALDYLLKPVDEDRFRVSVERAKKAIQQKRLRALSEQIAEVANSLTQPGPQDDKRHLIVRRGDELIRLSADEIVWLEAASQYVKVHTSNYTYLVAESLKHYQRRLPRHLFTRIHRSAVVNRARLSRVFKRPNGVHALELDNGTILSLARSRRDLLTDLLASCNSSDPARRHYARG